jgi:hypothetical protein
MIIDFKIFENQTDDSKITDSLLRSLLKEKNEIDNKIAEIKRDIELYLIYNPELLPKELQTDDPEFLVFEFHFYGDNFNAEISWDDEEEGETIKFNQDRYVDLLSFINNKDMYLDAKKYNL